MAKFAKKEVKEKVIRSDQLVKYIKDMYNNSKNTTDSDKGLLAWAQSYLYTHKDIEKYSPFNKFTFSDMNLSIVELKNTV